MQKNRQPQSSARDKQRERNLLLINHPADLDLPDKGARAILYALTREEFPSAELPDPSGTFVCVTTEHRSLHKEFTGSLGIKRGGDGKLRVKCFSACCNFGQEQPRTLAEYFSNVGPDFRGETAGHRYFIQEGNLARLVREINEGKTPTLGWGKWLQDRGLSVNTGGGEAVKVELDRIANDGPRAGLAELRIDCEYSLGAMTPDALQKTCDARKWDPAVVQELIAERKLGVFPMGEGDVRIAAAISGIIPNPLKATARAVKLRNLFDKSRSSMVDPLYTPKISDFSSIEVDRTRADTVVITEGEMDAVSARMLYPKALNYWIAGTRQYNRENILELLPRCSIQNRHVLLCIDNDFKDQVVSKFDPKSQKRVENHVHDFTNRKVYDAFMEKVLAQFPKSVSLWMCPPEVGKDLNDWTKNRPGEKLNTADMRRIVETSGAQSSAPVAEVLTQAFDSYSAAHGRPAGAGGMRR